MAESKKRKRFDKQEIEKTGKSVTDGLTVESYDQLGVIGRNLEDKQKERTKVEEEAEAEMQAKCFVIWGSDNRLEEASTIIDVPKVENWQAPGIADGMGGMGGRTIVFSSRNASDMLHWMKRRKAESEKSERLEEGPGEGLWSELEKQDIDLIFQPRILELKEQSGYPDVFDNPAMDYSRASLVTQTELPFHISDLRKLFIDGNSQLYSPKIFESEGLIEHSRGKKVVLDKKKPALKAEKSSKENLDTEQDCLHEFQKNPKARLLPKALLFQDESENQGKPKFAKKWIFNSIERPKEHGALFSHEQADEMAMKGRMPEAASQLEGEADAVPIAMGKYVHVLLGQVDAIGMDQIVLDWLANAAVPADDQVAHWDPTFFVKRIGLKAMKGAAAPPADWSAAGPAEWIRAEEAEPYVSYLDGESMKDEDVSISHLCHPGWPEYDICIGGIFQGINFPGIKESEGSVYQAEWPDPAAPADEMAMEGADWTESKVAAPPADLLHGPEVAAQLEGWADVVPIAMGKYMHVPLGQVADEVKIEGAGAAHTSPDWSEVPSPTPTKVDGSEWTGADAAAPSAYLPGIIKVVGYTPVAASQPGESAAPPAEHLGMEIEGHDAAHICLAGMEKMEGPTAEQLGGAEDAAEQLVWPELDVMEKMKSFGSSQIGLEGYSHGHGKGYYLSPYYLESQTAGLDLKTDIRKSTPFYRELNEENIDMKMQSGYVPSDFEAHSRIQLPIINSKISERIDTLPTIKNSLKKAMDSQTADLHIADASEMFPVKVVLATARSMGIEDLQEGRFEKSRVESEGFRHENVPMILGSDQADYVRWALRKAEFSELTAETDNKQACFQDPWSIGPYQSRPMAPPDTFTDATDDTCAHSQADDDMPF